MGINRLTTLINRFVIKEDILISAYAGGKVAIDIHNIIFGNFKKYYTEAIQKIDVLNNESVDRKKIIQKIKMDIVNLSESWIRQYVTPVLIYDGKNRNRKLVKLSSEETIKNCRKLMGEVKNSIEKAKENKTKINDLIIDDDFDSVSSVSDEDVLDTSENIKKKLVKISYPYWHEIDEIREFTIKKGIPSIISRGEGEKLCASLCLAGKVDAVFTSDSDIFAYGCPDVLFNTVKSVIVDGVLVKAYTRVKMEDVLKSFDLNLESFIDFCILLGCDFNRPLYNLKNYKDYFTVAIKCYGHIRDKGGIKNFDKSLKDKVVERGVKYTECQKLFEAESWENLVNKSYGMEEYFEERKNNKIGIFSLWKERWMIKNNV